MQKPKKTGIGHNKQFGKSAPLEAWPFTLLSHKCVQSLFECLDSRLCDSDVNNLFHLFRSYLEAYSSRFPTHQQLI
jgi:hypothetical protein